jgi:hypothetical protein
MNKKLAVFSLLFVLPVFVYSQGPTPNPTPNPPNRRRAFDQFDVSGGVQISSPVAQAVSPERHSGPVVAEPLDEGTYNEIIQLIEYSSNIEQAYQATASQMIDPAYVYAPEKILQKKLVAVYRILELHRSGLLGQKPLSNVHNLEILKANQAIIEDMMTALSLMQADKASYAGKVGILSDRYAVSPIDGVAAGEKLVEKRSLLMAMFSLLNKNFALLKDQIVLAK